MDNDKQNLEELYKVVKSYLEKVDFSLLWKGFKPLKFALYNDETVFFDGKYVEKTSEFIANTAIEYKGEMIGIWNVMEDIDPIVLASKMIHEMFHGFQRMNNETRFPDELDALYNYQYSDENLSIKLEENKLLVKLLDNYNVDDFNKLLGLRSYRADKFKYQYKYESLIEQIEGSANNVELNALKQLSNDLYLEKLNSLKNSIVEKSNFLPIRVLCYDIGAMLLEVLKRNNLTFNEGFSKDSFSMDLIKDVKAVKADTEFSFQEEIKKYFDRAEEIINNAIDKNDVVVEGSYNILGVNVYNAIFYKGYIISIYFLMYGNQEAPNIEYGNFVIESKGDKILTKVYRY